MGPFLRNDLESRHFNILRPKIFWYFGQNILARKRQEIYVFFGIENIFYANFVNFNDLRKLSITCFS